MTITPDGSVVVQRHIKARPETVFSFFTDSERWLSWQGIEGVLDPTPGGAYRMRVVGDATAAGHFEEVEPYTRIVLTWGWENEGDPVPPGSSRIEVTFSPSRTAPCSRSPTPVCPSRPASRTRRAGSTTSTGSPYGRPAATPARTAGCSRAPPELPPPGQLPHSPRLR